MFEFELNILFVRMVWFWIDLYFILFFLCLVSFISELPATKPILWTERDRYESGEILVANCSSPPSQPRVELKLSINNLVVSAKFYYFRNNYLKRKIIMLSSHISTSLHRRQTTAWNFRFVQNDNNNNDNCNYSCCGSKCFKSKLPKPKPNKKTYNYTCMNEISLISFIIMSSNINIWLILDIRQKNEKFYNA